MTGLRYIVVSVFVLFSITISFAQKEANIWYFGNQAGLDFNSGAPIALTDNGIINNKFYFGSASIADVNGYLLFYSDGETILNKNHILMVNGTLKPSNDSVGYQNVIIVPKPNSNTIYYIFTTGWNSSNGNYYGLRYSEIDMSLDIGLGAVTATKNVVLNFDAYGLTAVLHANGHDIWVVTHGKSNNQFNAYLVNSLGVSTIAVASNIGQSSQNRSLIKISPNGKKLALCLSGVGSQLFNFNNATGIIDNPVNLSNRIYDTGAEFSATGKMLYISQYWYGGDALYQYDLNATNIRNSEQLLVSDPSGDTYGFSELQIGPDQKIYVSQIGMDIGVINSPDIPGVGCNFLPNSVSLNGRTCRNSLPQFIQSYFYVGIFTENVCQGELTRFHLNSSETFDSLLWDFGEPSTGTNNTSTEFEPTHIFSSPGTYEVQVTAILGTQSVTESTIVTIYESPEITPLVELKQCDDNLDGFSMFNLNEVIDEITSNASNETIAFYESESDANSRMGALTNTTTYTNETVSTDVVWARVENAIQCYKTSQVNLTVTTTQIPSDFIRDFYACDDLDGDDTNGISIFDFSHVNTEIQNLFPIGQDLVITYYKNDADALAEQNAITNISNYRNTGYPNMQQIYVRVDGQIDNDCIGLGAHINLYVAPLPDFTIETPQIVCSSDPNFTVVLDPIENNPSEIFEYQWTYQDGTILSSASTLTVSTPGVYTITLTTIDGTRCSRSRDIFVNASELATITQHDITIVEFSQNNSIAINTNNLGLGDYEFALDTISGPYQDNPLFEHLASGGYTIYVRDKNGCGIAELDVFIMGFPQFFTPNNDGYNDTWNIKGLSHEYSQDSTIYIFDRYGKLIEQLEPRGEGWNGNFNGRRLPASDYWFVIELVNLNGSQKTYRGHFTLVR